MHPPLAVFALAFAGYRASGARLGGFRAKTDSYPIHAVSTPESHPVRTAFTPGHTVSTCRLPIHNPIHTRFKPDSHRIHTLSNPICTRPSFPSLTWVTAQVQRDWGDAARNPIHTRSPPDSHPMPPVHTMYIRHIYHIHAKARAGRWR